MKKKEVKKRKTLSTKRKTAKKKKIRKIQSFFLGYFKKIKKFYKKKKTLLTSFFKKKKRRGRKKKSKFSISKIHIPKYLPIVVGTILLILIAFCMDPDCREINGPSIVVDPIPVDVEDSLPGVNIPSLQETYQNSDIIGYIEIPNVISYPIVKASDNTYYLNHMLDHSQNIKGSPFMDYRIHFEDRKILIYGHSGKEEDLPFLQLHRYESVDFYKEHPTMYLYSSEKIYTYQIFASYLEGQDYDYVNINTFRGLSWLEHIQKLQSKSDYSIPVTLDENSKILILQTCNVEEDYIGGTYRLLIGVLTKEEKNSY